VERKTLGRKSDIQSLVCLALFFSFSFLFFPSFPSFPALPSVSPAASSFHLHYFFFFFFPVYLPLIVPLLSFLSLPFSCRFFFSLLPPPLTSLFFFLSHFVALSFVPPFMSPRYRPLPPFSHLYLPPTLLSSFPLLSFCLPALPLPFVALRLLGTEASAARPSSPHLPDLDARFLSPLLSPAKWIQVEKVPHVSASSFRSRFVCPFFPPPHLPF